MTAKGVFKMNLWNNSPIKINEFQTDLRLEIADPA